MNLLAANTTESVFNPGSTGVLAPGRLFKTRSLLWALLLFVVVLGFFFASVLGANWLGLRGRWFDVPAVVIPGMGCCAYALLVRRFERRQVRELATDRRTAKELLVGFLAGGILVGVMWALLLAFKLYQTRRGVWTGWFEDLVFDSYISAVLEELAFRGVLLRIFSRIWGARTGVVLSSILFGLAHFSHGSWLGMVGITVNAGVTMGLLYVLTGKLWMSIGLHLGYDFVETSVLGVGSNHGLLISSARVGHAEWLTGGSFGPDAAVPAMILGAAVNLYLWKRTFQTPPRNLQMPL